tara:strand:- start:95 stop:547 length:453 start_codon:yes stop_codon:yes gene_type:complete
MIIKMKKNRFFKKIALLVLPLFIFSCSHIEVNDTTIKIRPYNKNDRGKFWNICIDYENIGFSDKPTAYFEIHSKDKKKKEYSIDFIHLKQECNDKNILVSFTGRHTPHEEWEWLNGLDAVDVDHVIVKIKRHWKDNSYIFEKKIDSKNLK